MSCVRCHMSCVTCHFFSYFFLTMFWSLSVEGLLSTGPTPPSFNIPLSLDFQYWIALPFFSHHLSSVRTYPVRNSGLNITIIPWTFLKPNLETIFSLSQLCIVHSLQLTLYILYIHYVGQSYQVYIVFCYTTLDTPELNDTLQLCTLQRITC